MPGPNIPAPGQIVTPFVGVENSVMSLVQAPFRDLGFPVPPNIPLPASIIRQFLTRIPRFPGLPR